MEERQKHNPIPRFPENNGASTNSGAQIQYRHPKYESYQERISSFGDWQSELSQTPKQLVEAGFFFTGHCDLVQCFHCNGLIHGWRAGDGPWTKHALRFPYCQYVIQKKGLEFIRRVNGEGIHQERQIEESKKNNGASTNSGAQIQYRHPKYESYQERISSFGDWQSESRQTPGQLAEAGFFFTENNGASTNSGAQIQYRHPKYESYQERISSFGDWQSESRQTPGQLAEAGFFFTGDEVRCYACDGGLRSWDACDQPWLEHARWFPNCSHVLAVKGANYVQLVLQALEHQGDNQQQDINSLEGQNYTTPETMTAVNGTQTNNPSENNSDCVGDTETNTDVDDSGESGEAGPANILCVQCNDKTRNVLFVPCSHLIVCSECAQSLSKCPYCQDDITYKVRRSFLSAQMEES